MNEENQCKPRDRHNNETTKRKQITNFSCVYHMDAESNANCCVVETKGAQRLAKSFTFDGASVGNWIGDEVALRPLTSKRSVCRAVVAGEEKLCGTHFLLSSFNRSNHLRTFCDEGCVRGGERSVTQRMRIAHSPLKGAINCELNAEWIWIENIPLRISRFRCAPRGCHSYSCCVKTCRRREEHERMNGRMVTVKRNKYLWLPKGELRISDCWLNAVLAFPLKCNWFVRRKIVNLFACREFRRVDFGSAALHLLHIAHIPLHQCNSHVGFVRARVYRLHAYQSSVVNGHIKIRITSNLIH